MRIKAFRVELTDPGNENAALAWSSREDGHPVHYDSEPLAGVWRRLIAGLLGTLAPEELL